MPKLFVYGTLRRGEKNYNLLGGAANIYRQCWTEGTLYDTGLGYPALEPTETDRIFGELYNVSDAQLKEIDELESYVEGAPNNLFERVPAKVFNDIGEECEAYTYTSGLPESGRAKRIQSGDWLVYNYLKQDKLLYFAYGSCMDNERFRIAKVDQHFLNIKGRGTVDEFEFKFSRDSEDGGKADLVENKLEKVEGVVYEVEEEAIEYLYKREGVYSKAYRPAVIPVTMDGTIYQAITFIGIDKSDETAPTNLYGTEIIRGGKEYLSDDYIKKIKKKIDKFLVN
ncbi:gamma-glutamylcyclotransferase [Virgibacillus kekensis]|uniref:Gamma-glutamylcyclotransferase n=1 Tax=Virgibacillus kekensis TaxID=202261 RepID=A0ABV9DGQ8_9BACI